VQMERWPDCKGVGLRRNPGWGKCLYYSFEYNVLSYTKNSQRNLLGGSRLQSRVEDLCSVESKDVAESPNGEKRASHTWYSLGYLEP
jgi:hypothetical protein